MQLGALIGASEHSSQVRRDKERREAWGTGREPFPALFFVRTQSRESCSVWCHHHQRSSRLVHQGKARHSVCDCTTAPHPPQSLQTTPIHHNTHSFDSSIPLTTRSLHSGSGRSVLPVASPISAALRWRPSSPRLFSNSLAPPSPEHAITGTAQLAPSIVPLSHVLFAINLARSHGITQPQSPSSYHLKPPARCHGHLDIT